MAYNVNHSDVANYGSLIVEDKTLNNDTSLSLVGRFYPGYSKYVAENFLHLLENFASNNSPLNPTRGQLWFDTDSTSSIPQPKLMMWNGTRWLPVGLVSRSVNEPSTPVDGDLWVNPETHELGMWNSTSGAWIVFQSDLVNDTGIKYSTCLDNTQVTHNVIVARVNGAVVAVFNGDDEFTPNAPYTGFNTTIKKGINIPIAHTFVGTADKASAITDGTNTATYSKLFIKDKTNESTGNIVVKNDNGITVYGGTTGLASAKYVSVKPTPNYIDFSSNTDIRIVSNNTASISTNILISLSTITINKPLTISNGSLTLSNGSVSATNITASGALTVASAIIGSKIAIQDDISPVTHLDGSLGTTNKRWNNIYASQLIVDRVGTPDTQYTGKLSNSVTYNGNSILNGSTTFSLSNDVTGSVTPGSNATVNIIATLSPQAITHQSAVTSSLPTDHILLERSTTGLKSISVSNFTRSNSLIGSIIMYAHGTGVNGTAAPSNYVLCDGASYNTSAYPELYDVIGTTYGQSTGKFNVPNITHAVATIKYYIYAGR